VTTLLGSHPFPVIAHFEFSLVLAYALPASVLEPCLPAGLLLDRHEDLGFVAVALVSTKGLRPAGIPLLPGRNFLLVGTRIFSRLPLADGRSLRGLHVLRSDTDSRFLVAVGNLLTGYRYHEAVIRSIRNENRWSLSVRAQDAVGNLDIECDPIRLDPGLPADSPFCDQKDAARFAGPMPYTFAATTRPGQFLVVKGVRKHWNPRPVEIRSARCGILETPPFAGSHPVLANAFLVEGVDYRWERGDVMRSASQS
jgi:hypothetical protein